MLASAAEFADCIGERAAAAADGEKSMACVDVLLALDLSSRRLPGKGENSSRKTATSRREHEPCAVHVAILSRSASRTRAFFLFRGLPYLMGRSVRGTLSRSGWIPLR